MALALQNHSLLLSFCHIDLCLRIEELLAPIPFCLHLKFQLPLNFTICRLERLDFESSAIYPPCLEYHW
jgi:hypothetical protein